MTSVPFDTVGVPPGTDVRLFAQPPFHMVVVAPPGTKADLGTIFATGLAGCFTFDDGLDWPDREGCTAATAYLAAGHPVCMVFEDVAAATSCRDRLRELVH